MKNNILFIAGGIWQKPFVQYLKNKGHYIFIVNPIETETTKLADYHIKLDVNNIEEINKYIQNINPIFITSDQSDISTMIVSKLSEKWNLPGNYTNVIEKFTNKFSIYNFAKFLNIPVPNSQIANNIEDIKTFGQINNFPIIIKPTDSTMSRGFAKINTIEEITEDIYLHCKKFSKSGQVIIQKFIPGYMIILDGICSGGKHKTIATSKKEEYFKPGITSNVYYPAEIDQTILEKVIETNNYYVEKSNMQFGLTHSEYILNGNDFYLIEIGARGGGAGITDKIIPWVSGINTYDILYNSLMGNIIDVKKINLLNRFSLLRYYDKKEVDNYTKEKEKIIREISGVADFYYNFAGQQFIHDANDNRHTMAIYLANSKQEINEINNKIDTILNPN